MLKKRFKAAASIFIGMADQIEHFLEAIGEKGNTYAENKIRNSPKTKWEDDALIAIDLSGLGIIALYPEMLEPLAGVQDLDLSDNMIEFIPEGLFASLNGLKKLNLRDNPIYTYHPKAFEGLNDLESLDLGNTQIFYLNPKVFEQMPNLKSIDLRGTKLPKSLAGLHSDIDRLKQLAEQEKYMKKAPSKLYFWNNIIFSYLAILCFLTIPFVVLSSGNSLNAIAGGLFVLGLIFLFLDFGVMKRHIGAMHS